MAYMKTLTVSGQTYQVKDPEAVSLTRQTLTPDQQAQARENLALWSRRETIDTLCPGFRVQEQCVACKPVEGHPMEVVSHLETAETPYTQVNLTRCGKNLWRFEDIGKQLSINQDSNAAKLETGLRATQTRANAGYCSIMCRWLPISVLDGKTVTLSCKIASSNNSLVPMLQMGYFSETMTKRAGVVEIYKTGSLRMTVDSNSAKAAGCEYVGFWFYIQTGDGRQVKAGDYVDYTDIQIELGDTATPYAPYQGGVFTVPLDTPVEGGVFNWSDGVLTDQSGNTYQLTPQEITALAGTNIFYSDTGATQVTGKVSPAEMLWELYSQVNALSAATQEA